MMFFDVLALIYLGINVMFSIFVDKTIINPILNMKQLILMLSLIPILLPSEAYANVITPQEAILRLSSSNHIRVSQKNAAQLHLIRTIKCADTPTVYLFSDEHTRTYVLSADDMTAPVLGFTDTAASAEAELPPQLEGLLEQYSVEIDNIRKSGKNETFVETSAPKAPIEPMCAAKWGVGDPYNRKCPEVNGSKSLAGAGAVAMAQVMKYFEWPPKGTGTGTAQDTDKNTYTMPLDVDFDWAEIANTNYIDEVTDAQAEAVSTLMAACGYAIGSEYSPYGTASSIINITRALKENFNYSKALKFDRKLYYNMETWCDKVYDSLADGSPVIYRGFTPWDGGHIFVCDGYADGYFHINWGWYGSFNGYFLLTALNPQASLSWTTEGGYSEGQWAIFNIKKDDGTTVEPDFEVAMDNSLTPELLESEDGKQELRIYSYFCNMASNPIDMVLGIGVFPNGPYTIDNIIRLLPTSACKRGVEPTAGWNYVTCTWNDGDLAPGRYLFQVLAAPYDYQSVKEFVPLKTNIAHHDYLYVEIADDYTPKVYTYNSNIVKIQNVRGTHGLKLYQCLYNEFEVTFYNHKEIPVEAFISPLMKVGDTYYRSECVFVHLEPLETLIKNVQMRFFYHDDVDEQKVSIIFADYDSNFYLSGPFNATLIREAGKTELSCNGIEVSDDGNSTLNFSTDIHCVEGYHASPLVFSLVFNEPESSYPEICNWATEIFCLEKGDTKSYATELKYKSELIGRNCIAILYYNGDDGLKKIAEKEFTVGKSGTDTLNTNMRKIASSKGAVSIYGYEGCCIKVYTTDGRCISNIKNASSSEHIILTPGIYIVNTDGSSSKVIVR